MPNQSLFILAAIACLVVLVILAMGISNFGKGGSPSTSNKLMRWRIGAQAIAVALIAGFAYLRSRGG
jgi:hypothetical protein